MKNIYKLLLIVLVAIMGISFAAKATAANLATNLTWCATNSGAINVSYSECNGLAYLYSETSGDKWGATGNRFSATDLTTWAHPSTFLTGAITVEGGHITKLNLQYGNLTGTITTGLIYLPYLTQLDLASAMLNTINLSQNTGLLILGLSNTNVSGLNITMLTGLKQFSVGGTRLLQINLSQNINLTGLVINYTPMTYIDLSHNTGLQTISFAFNALTGLDVSNLSALSYLEAAYQSGANMRYTNFSGATSIYQVWLSENGLTGINLLPIGGALSILKLDGNHIQNLSLTGNYSLGYTNLIGNSITSLDLSKNPYLSALFLGDGNTGLTYLDLSQSTGLQIVDTSGIVLTGFKAPVFVTYPSQLVAYFTGNAFDPATLSLDELRFLNHYMPGWGFRGIGGGGKTIVIAKDNCPNGDTSMTQYDGLCSGVSNRSAGSSVAMVSGAVTTGSSVNTGTIVVTGNTVTPTPEVRVPLTAEKDVYDWAFTHHITTLPLAKARLHDSIQRYEAAKMIVQFAENVMHTQIAHNPLCDVTKYADYSSFDSEMTANITKACDLGLMGWAVRNQTLMSAFRPFDTLTAVEFGIVVGRYLGESDVHPSTSQRVDIMRFLNSVSTD